MKLLLYSKLFWYLFLSDLRSSAITSSSSSLAIIAILSLFESMTHSSSLSVQDIKLIAYVN